MRNTIIAGNWKMNKDLEEARALAISVSSSTSTNDNVKTILGVPFPFLSEVADICEGSENLHIAAQNLFPQDQGAYTGEVSAPMIISCGVEYVILGHSERREYFHEDNEFINRKVQYALKKELKPILCIGEPLEIRERKEHVNFVLDQLTACLKDVTVEQAGALILAYEPIWAIGTGQTAEPYQAEEMHATIRKHLETKWGSISQEIPILYGGSMKPKNAESLLNCENIDGGLIGGASLESESFLEIRSIAESL